MDNEQLTIEIEPTDGISNVSVHKSLTEIIEKPISGEWGSDGNSVKVIRTTNFTNEGRLDLRNVVTRDIPAKKVDLKRLQPGDIIIEKSGGSPTQPVGRVVFFAEDELYLCNNFTSILRPQKEKVFPKYLLYILFCNHKYGFTNGFQNKTTGIINLQLTRRQKDKALIEKYNELTKSLFLDMFGDPVTNPKGWEKGKFSEVGQLDRGKSKHRPRNAPELLGGDYPLIQTGDVANCSGYIREYKSTYSEIGLKQSKMWDKGTLCITIAANIAKTGILMFDACFPDSVVGFIPNSKTNSLYIQFWLSFLQKTLEDSAPESAQKNINLAILRKLDLPLPPIYLQNKFADLVMEVEKQKQQAELGVFAKLIGI